jgi:carbon monoxide dehydrogenase subunit G
MPSESFRHSIEITAKPSDAWASLQDPDTWAAIGGVERVFDVRTSPDGTLAGYRFGATAGGRTLAGETRVVDSKPGELMTLEIDSPELAGVIEVRLANGRVEVRLDVRSVGLLASLFFPVISSALRSGFPGQVQVLASRL